MTQPALQAWILAFIAVCVLFALEEFVLIKPVSTVAASDPQSRRLELLALWVPAVGMGLTGAFIRSNGAVLLDGWVNAAGTMLCIAGIVMRYWSRRTLGRFFTIGVVKLDGHVVVRHGPYRFVRHPGYLGFLLFYLGLPLVVGSGLGLLMLSLPALVIFVALIVVEDRKLEESLGSDYAKYKAESSRLVPGIW